MSWLLLLVANASAIRPTEGGSFSFDSSDDVTYLDDATELVRVFYSVDGPNETDDYDRDEDGVRDFPANVAETAAEALALYEATGFRRPLDELVLGDEELGGSLAFDFYLVDFGGSSDGHFGTDSCSRDEAGDYVCSGYMVMENDFQGYYYDNDLQGITVLTSHELFHAVQAAYEGQLDTWISEGTATWAEHLFDDGNEDFLWYAQQYLDDCGRTVDSPPAGVLPPFAYGTAIFFDFLALRHGTDVVVEILEGTARGGGSAVEVVPMIEQVLEGRGDTLKDAWVAFATDNLATGSRAGLIGDYPYAEELDGVPMEDKGKSIDDDNRFYPLAATYYQFNHTEDGPIWLSIDEAAEDLYIAVHPVEGDQPDGPVDAAVASFFATDAGAFAVADGADMPAGYYVVFGAHAAYADDSVKRRLCVGDEDQVRDCLPVDTGDTGDTADTGDTDEQDPTCGCASPVGGLGIAWLLPGLLLLGRRP